MVLIKQPRKRQISKEIRKRKNVWLKKYFKTYGRTLKYLAGNGCCLYCWEINPFMLNNHHIWGKKNDSFTITLCEDHHAPFTRGMPFVLEGWCVFKETENSNG